MSKFQNKYRIETARATWWNYADDGIYFITICTDNQEHFFGRIENGKMNLSEIGLIVQEEWNKSFEIRKELYCDVYVIMPNHLHALVRIANAAQTHSLAVQTHGLAVQTHGRASVLQGVAYRPPRSISSFVAGFKSAATKRINEFRNMPKSPVWQSRFYDRIVRDHNEYRRIEKYILENPQNWDL